MTDHKNIIELYKSFVYMGNKSELIIFNFSFYSWLQNSMRNQKLYHVRTTRILENICFLLEEIAKRNFVFIF